MNTTHKIIVASALIINAGAAAVVSGIALTQDARLHTARIQLGTIVVTPDAKHTAVDLGAIMVTPTEADWRYAEAHGVQRPAFASIALGTIVVKPTAEQLADLAGATPRRSMSVTGHDAAESAAGASLIEALESFSPGKYLLNGSTLRVLNALVFERSGG